MTVTDQGKQHPGKRSQLSGSGGPSAIALGPGTPLARSHFEAFLEHDVKQAEAFVTGLEGHVDDFLRALLEEMPGAFETEPGLLFAQRNAGLFPKQPAEMARTTAQFLCQIGFR